MAEIGSQNCRQFHILAVGSGSFVVSLAAALFNAGLSRFHVFITGSMPTDRHRLQLLLEKARNSDPEASIEEMTLPKNGVHDWREAVRPFSWILYVSEKGDTEQLRALHAACRIEKKAFLPAICIQQIGLAGPLVDPKAEPCWESGWRRIHLSAIRKTNRVDTFPPLAGAMLANVIVFELVKMIMGEEKSKLNHTFYLLDLYTLEGSFHSYFPHPLVAGSISAGQFPEVKLRLEHNHPDSGERSEFLSYFSQLTSPVTGIFHLWDEGDLKQLPLSQCRVQVADPLSEGPAELLPIIICAGMTHKEAKKEAALAGTEAYQLRKARLPISIGAGETLEEAVNRGLQKCLNKELQKHVMERKPSVIRAYLSNVEDEHCRYYLQALTTIQGTPAIGIGEELFGFPVIWVGTHDHWYGSAGLNVTMALQMALLQALIKEQNNELNEATTEVEICSQEPEVHTPQTLVIPTYEEAEHPELLQDALQVLERSHKKLLVYDMELEPFMIGKLGGLLGIVIGEEEDQ